MAKQYDQSDFDQVVFRNNRESAYIPHANDEVSRVVGEQDPLEQRGSYRSSYPIPAIANDDTVEQKQRGVALHKEFDSLAIRLLGEVETGRHSQRTGVSYTSKQAVARCPNDVS